jgi:undecaprenyl-diphosphatase
MVITPLFFQSYCIYYLIKHFFKRARPFKQFDSVKRLDKTGHGYSFPSGHAHHSTLLIGIIWLIFIPSPWFVIILIAYNLVVGFSRMISGVHFPSDTIIGIIEAYLMLAFHWMVTKDLYINFAKFILPGLCNMVNLCINIIPL